MSDLIDRQAAIEAINRLDIPEDMCVFEILSHIELELGTLPSAQSDLEAKILAAGYTGKEVRIYIGGRLFGVRELAQ